MAVPGAGRPRRARRANTDGGPVASNAFAEGGRGRQRRLSDNGANGSAGGSAKASSNATSSGAGNVTSSASAIGDNGGSNGGGFNFIGDGGTGGLGTALATGGSGSGNVAVSASAIGGVGGVSFDLGS